MLHVPIGPSVFAGGWKHIAKWSLAVFDPMALPPSKGIYMLSESVYISKREI
jgi:hypothetical protein